ncbi:MAG: hypothetical protein ABI591_31905 [Kofleriaceae bacterium]
MSRLLVALPLVALLCGTALADDDGPPSQQSQPQQLPAPQSPLPVYVAPLSQTTQTTYVPQSVALSGPEEIDAGDDNRGAPLGYTPVERTRKGLLIGGGVSLGVSYGISALTAAIGQDVGDNGRNEVAAMWIPVAGPFIQMGETDSATARVFLAGLGAAQVAGAVMLYYGLTTTKKVYVRNDLVGSMTITPMAGNGSSGFALAGRF